MENLLIQSRVTHPKTVATQAANRRILIVDDNAAIRDDFQKILCTNTENAEFEAAVAELFNVPMEEAGERTEFELGFASQGQEALELVQAAVKAEKRYAMAFMDVRMPPGWDGLETTLKLWEVDPDIQIVICTAYSDYSWDEMLAIIPKPEQLLILKKPFDAIEVLQFAQALTDKWSLLQSSRRNTDELNRTVRERTGELRRTIELLEAEMAAHKAANARFETICEVSPLGIFMMDEKQRLIYANKALLDGSSMEELPALDWHARIHPDDRERMLAQWTAIEQNGEPFRATHRYCRKDGSLIWANVTVTAIRKEERLSGYMGIVEDITEQKRRDEQLIRSQRMESIGTLASGVAHDLNNILAPILMAASILHDLVPQEARAFTSAIEKSAQRGADIVKQVLTFARGIAGERINLQPRSLIKEVEEIVNGTFPKSITVRNSASNDLWTISGDSTQLHQVLLNLCINARDAMPEGGSLSMDAQNKVLNICDVEIHPDAKAGNYVVMSVADTGMGISPEIIEKIFDPFFTTKEVGKGTGLGLSTVMGIAKSHGGFVKVYSESGKGSTFHIYLPATPGQQPESRLPAKPALQSGNGEWILLVDDEDAIRTMTGIALKANGYNVLAAKDGIEALTIYAQYLNKIAVVLTDLMMPLLDGVKLTRALKEMNGDVAVIAATGQPDEVREMELEQLGVKMILQKPYSTARLLDALHHTIHG
jgi:PAS domain S-box-containing protein